MIIHSNVTSIGKQVNPAIPHTHGRSALLWAFFAVLGAVMVFNPQLIISEAWATQLSGVTAITSGTAPTVSGTGAAATVTGAFGGAELGNAALRLFGTITNVVGPVVTIVAIAFGLFAIVRGFNVAAIVSSFAVAIIAGVGPQILLAVSGTSASVF